MEDQLTEIKVHLAEIKTDLRHHIKRTELLEEEVKAWRADIQPIQKHVTIVNGLIKAVLFLATLATAAAGLANFK